MARGLAKLPTLKTRTQQTTVGSFKPRSSGIQTPYYAMSPEQQAQKNYEQTAQAVQSYGEDVNKAQDDRNIFEKALNLGQNQGFFGDVFEVLGRPGEAIKGAAMNPNPFEGAWQGITGQSHYSGEQVSEALGITNKNSPRWARTLAGFGMDLATDPLSYTNAPFEWAGKGIKGMAKKGYAMAASELSKTAKGAAIVDKLGEAFNRMGAVSKSAFGLWKNDVYKDFKTNVLNKANSRAVATEHIARDLKSINNEINSFAERMHKNPAEFRDERQALGLAEDASIDDVKKAVHEDLFNALEQHRQNNLSKMQVWEKLSTPADENGAGRFLIANAGKEAEEQGNALVRTIREDYHKANGRMLGDSEVSFTNGFVNVSPEVAKFLRREVNMQMRIADRMKVFGIEGALEGALQTLKDTGSVTLNLMDPAERMIYEKVTRLTDGRGVANIGSGAAQISLTPSEVAQILNDGDIQQILQESKDFGNNVRRYQELENQKAALQQRIMEIQRKNPSTKKLAELDRRMTKVLDNNVELQQELNKVETEITKLKQEISLNEVAVGKYKNKEIDASDKTNLTLKSQEVINQVFEKMPGLRKYFTEEEMGNIVDYIEWDYSASNYGSMGPSTNKYAAGLKIAISKKYLEDNALVRELEGTILHEFMHALDVRLGNKVIKDFIEKKAPLFNVQYNGHVSPIVEQMRYVERDITAPNLSITENIAEDNLKYRFAKAIQENVGGKWNNERIVAVSREINGYILGKQTEYIGNEIKKILLNGGYSKKDVTKLFRGVESVGDIKNLSYVIGEQHWAGELGNVTEDMAGQMSKDIYDRVNELLSTDELETQFPKLYEMKKEISNSYENIYYNKNLEQVEEITKKYNTEIQEILDSGMSKMDNFLKKYKDIKNISVAGKQLPSYLSDNHFIEYFAKKINTKSNIIAGKDMDWIAEIVPSMLIPETNLRLTGVEKYAMESKYREFFSDYMNNVLGLDFSETRTIKGEIAEAQKRGAEMLSAKDKKLGELYANREEFEKNAKLVDEQLAILRGQKVTVEQAKKDLAKKIKAQKGTIEEYAKKFGVDLTPESTEQDLLNAFQSDKTFVVKFTGPQAEAANQLGLLQKWMEWNDNKFYKVKMADPVLVGVSDKFESILNSLEGVKQQIYQTIGDTFAQTGTQLGNVLEKLNIDGYMRHVINTESTIYLEIERLKSINKFTAEKARKMIPTLGSNAKIFDQKWLGSVTDINKRLGIELFNSNPIESMAVLLNILPEHFEVTNLFQSAFDAGLIRTISEEEVNTLIQEVQKGMEQGLTRYEANRRAYEALLEDEFVLVDEQIVKQINQSFDFLKHGGAKTAELKALQDQIEQIAAGRGMVMHKGVINQIKQYGKSMSNRDLQVIMDNVKKYFVNPFKSLATLSAGFHIRNNITNITNAYLAGVKPTEFMAHFSRATRDITRIENQIIPKLQKMITSGEERIRTVAGQLEWMQEHLKPEELSLMNKMNEWQSKGVIGVNRYSKDLSELIRGINQGGGNKIMDGFKRVTEASMKLGKLSDDASKIAMYEWARTTKNGAKTLAQHGFKQPEQFSKFVFFDYSDLTAFEQRYMKAVFPFYTWARKNIEFQIKNFMKNTNRYIRLQKALSHWQSYMAGDEKDNLTQWDLEQMQIPVMKKDGKLTMLKVSPAFLDLADTAQHPLNKLSPLLKAPLEAFAGVNFFSGKKIDEGPLAEFGQSIFGDFGELGKAFRGQQYDKSKLGLVGGKMVAGKTAVESLVQGQATPSTLLPSVFRESDTQANRVMNINARTSRMRSYIQGLQRAGRTPTYATPGMRPRSRQQLFEMQQRNK